MSEQRAAREREIEKALRNVITRFGGMCLKWVCPGWAGVPDRIILLPGGLVIFAELKRPKGGKVTALQRWWAVRLKELGFRHLFIKSDTDLAVLRAILEETYEE